MKTDPPARAHAEGVPDGTTDRYTLSPAETDTVSAVLEPVVAVSDIVTSRSVATSFL